MRSETQRPHLYFMTRGPDNVTVRVQSLPTSSAQAFDQQVTVTPGETATILVPAAFQHPLGNVLASDGIAITAPSRIFVDVYLETASNNDAHSLIPDAFLGQEYFAAAYGKFYSLTASFILVVAGSDATGVSIELSKLAQGETIEMGGVTYDRQDTLSLTLDRLQTLQIQTASDLTGTRISATQPVATYSGQNRTLVPGRGRCLSHLSDQLPPVDNLGRKFVLVTSPDQGVGDVYRFVATRPVTTVVVASDPTTTIRLLSPGQSHELQLASGQYLFAEADQPVMVVQITKTNEVSAGGSGDPSMGVLAPLEQAESFYAYAHSRRADYLYITFVVKR